MLRRTLQVLVIVNLFMLLSSISYAERFDYNWDTGKMDKVLDKADEISTTDNSTVQAKLDTLSNQTTAVFGLWELDVLGNMMPLAISAVDTYWELDSLSNLMPKAP